jgi:DNA-binding PadR family transcriptional regulator
MMLTDSRTCITLRISNYNIMSSSTRMSPKELLALRALIDNPRGLYGSEFVALTEGALSRGSVYNILERLVDKGFVRETVDPPESKYLVSRTRHTITGAGQRAYYAFLTQQGLKVDDERSFGSTKGRPVRV